MATAAANVGGADADAVNVWGSAVVSGSRWEVGGVEVEAREWSEGVWVLAGSAVVSGSG